MKTVIEETEKCLSEVIVADAYRVIGVEFVKEGPHYYLRVYIDKDGGVTIKDCEYVSRRLEKVLDAKDFIKQSYILEVSSPGGYMKNGK